MSSDIFSPQNMITGILKEKSFLCDFESKFECFLHLKYNLLHNMVRPCGIIDRGRRGLDRMVVGFTTTYDILILLTSPFKSTKFICYSNIEKQHLFHFHLHR
jgi:hypothetical protein